MREDNPKNENGLTFIGLSELHGGAYRIWRSSTNRPRTTQITRRNGVNSVKICEIRGKKSRVIQHPPNLLIRPLHDSLENNFLSSTKRRPFLTPMQFGIVAYLLASLFFTLLYGCVGRELYLVGTWTSMSITNQSPFFKDTLPDTKLGSVKASFDQSGYFIWDDIDGSRITGTYILDGKHLVMTSSTENETTRLSYDLTGNRLVIESEDGFVFTFTKNSNDR